ncbi:MAG: hypothetical protein V3U57_03565 [Robiginitomaculum sp.]
MKRYTIIAPLFALMLSINAHATDDTSEYSQMKGKALQDVFKNTKMLGEYKRYRKDTQTFSYTEFHNKNGTTDYKEGKSANEPGVWKLIGDDKVCYKYPKSKRNTKTYCFFVYKFDKCYYKYSLGQMTLRGPRNWDDWSSRAVRKGDGGSCATPLS